MARRPPRPFVAVALSALIVAAAGCGKSGPPRPPLPRGPHPPREVSARQLGRRAVVGFVVPEPRGGKPSQEAVRAELLRVSYKPGLQPPDDPDAFRRRGDLVGQIETESLVPGSLLVLEDLELDELPDMGVQYTLRYGVRIRDRRGRSSPLVVASDLQLLPTAAAVRSMQVEPTADGVRVGWQPPAAEGSFTYNLYRSRPDEPWPSRPLNQEPLAATEYLDRDVTTGESYTYGVRVVLTPDRPYREGEPSETKEVVAEDRFAPGAPTAVVVVQEGLAVRVFWDPNPERDLAGYRVERRIDDGAWTPTDPARVETPSFLDADVEIGHRVAYRIFALDRAQPTNISASSAVVELEIVPEPVAP